MCGIAGFTHSLSPPDPGIIRRASASIRHRGPDQAGFYEDPRISLAAVRLKILDLATGDQPITSPDGSTVIVFNGEIYNFRELRHELISLGHTFRSQGDTEVVLASWLEWRHDCFRKLHGMFALALWEGGGRRLILARDRLGIKPLYLTRRGGDLHFGSEVKAILAHPAIERRLDTRALSDYLSLNYIPQPRTLIAGIEKLAPGHWLEWGDGEIRTEPFWQLKFAPRRDLPLEDARRELDFLIDRAVREHLVSDVPLGVWLSGGIDSSTVTHYAVRHFPGRLKTFSVSFRGRRFDESPYFREVARAYGTDHEEFDLAPESGLAEAIERISYYSDEPSADAGALPVWFLSEMTRRHVTVALSGEGADELFGGYHTYLADRYAARLRRLPAVCLRAALAAARLLPPSDEKIGLDYKLTRFLEGALLPPVEAHLFWNGAATPQQKRALLGLAHPPSPAEELPPLPGSGAVNRFLYLDQLLYLPEDILYKCDRMSMAHSLEVRPPFLDHRIVEFAASLPENYKVRGRTLKFLLRSLMRDKLPRPVVKRSKEGFDIPTHHWFRTVLRPLLLDTLTRQAVEDLGALRWPAVEALIEAHLSRRINAGYQLWGLLTLFLWARRWKIAPGDPAFIPESVTSSSS